MKKNFFLKILLIPLLVYTLTLRCMAGELVVCLCESGQITIEMADQCSEKCPGEIKRNPTCSSSAFLTNASENIENNECRDIPLLFRSSDQNAIRFSCAPTEIKSPKNETFHICSQPRFSAFHKNWLAATIAFDTSTFSSISNTILIV